MKPTICDPALRTYGRVGGGSGPGSAPGLGDWPACGSAEDKWRSTPWRAPGTAPVLDACGMAGGTPKETHSGAQYFTTPHGRQGDLGSKTLPPLPTGTIWEAGGVSIQQRSVHAVSSDEDPDAAVRLPRSPGRSTPIMAADSTFSSLLGFLRLKEAAAQLVPSMPSHQGAGHRGVLPISPATIHQRLADAALERQGRRDSQHQGAVRDDRHAPAR